MISITLVHIPNRCLEVRYSVVYNTHRKRFGLEQTCTDIRLVQSNVSWGANLIMFVLMHSPFQLYSFGKQKEVALSASLRLYQRLMKGCTLFEFKIFLTLGMNGENFILLPTRFNLSVRKKKENKMMRSLKWVNLSENSIACSFLTHSLARRV